jgi:WD40 repeat protein
VAAASPGGSIWVTDLATAKSTEIKGAGSGVSALALSLDGSLLAGGNSDRELFVWNLNKRKMEYRFGGNDFAIQQLAFTPDSRKITTLAADGTVRVYWLDLDQLKEHARKLLAQWPQ